MYLSKEAHEKMEYLVKIDETGKKLKLFFILVFKWIGECFDKSFDHPLWKIMYCLFENLLISQKAS